MSVPGSSLNYASGARGHVSGTMFRPELTSEDTLYIENTRHCDRSQPPFAEEASAPCCTRQLRQEWIAQGLREIALGPKPEFFVASARTPMQLAKVPSPFPDGTLLICPRRWGDCLSASIN